MVKNTSGGCKSKKMARKLCQTSFTVSSASTTTVRYSLNENEEYAHVKKMFGNGRCLVITHTNKELHCIIRNKFRGRSKRGNIVSVGSYLLIGLREWESKTGHKTCDLLEVYEEDEVMLLKNNNEFKNVIKEKEEKDGLFSDLFSSATSIDETDGGGGSGGGGGGGEDNTLLDEYIEDI